VLPAKTSAAGHLPQDLEHDGLFVVTVELAGLPRGCEQALKFDQDFDPTGVEN